ncbi:uncharacterized protein LOC113323962 [Papaver somniferum]|uniref:uncharacterized protein LOC113323962 n=1 Tax=Papaver somniferum TaxID=3469 RepID=UPI000E6FEA22|nr:uncharacterized protein LOC113323962 [Papaver somniferum]XP_026428100.1 uncharacterized protein LOC113323962 [Papaver somniferum]
MEGIFVSGTSELEGIFVSGTSELLKRLVYVVDEELDWDSYHSWYALDISDHLESLRRTLETIEDVTFDAERKQMSDAVVKLWLIKLKEIAYDADDILDTLFYDAVLRSRNIKVPLFFSLHDPIDILLPDIIKNFDRVSSEMFNIYRRIRISNPPSQSSQKQKRLTSASDVDYLLQPKKYLKLRYDNLPSHLKQCFSYFSLFPKDWKFDRETLIQMWMAEGFLDQPSNRGNQNSLEDIGNDYFSSLLSCSLFENVEYDELGDIITFKMHNYVHDFALSVVGRHEVIVLNESEYEKSDRSEILRLQLVLDEGRLESSRAILLRGIKLRTIFCGCNLGWTLEMNSPKLRVIHLAGVCKFTIPDDYRNHLRYLHLTDCGIRKTDVSKLYLLQTLNLFKCRNVNSFLRKIGSLQFLRHLSISGSSVEVLPKSIVKLRNLQSLDISHLPISELPDSINDICSLRRLKFHNCHNLKALPSNLGSLTQLRSLDLEGTGITELPDSVSQICNLKRLNFRYCKNLKALPSNLGALTQLRSLNLEGSGITELPDSICRIYNLERLEFSNCSELKALPHDIGALTQLRSLNLEGTGIIELPESLTSNLWKFESVNINRLEVLMPFLVRKIGGVEHLAGLISLRVLEIRYLDYVKGLEDAGKADLGNKKKLRELSLKWEEEGVNSVEVLEDLRPHPNLEKLVIENFGGVKLPKWMGSSSIYCFLNLVELYLSNCNRCEKLPAMGMLPCLRVLWIYGMMSMKCLGQEFYYQEEEEEEESTTGSSEATTITISFPSLTRLELGDMDNLEEWVAPKPPYYICFPVLETLSIIGCCELTSIPDFQLCTSLRELTIEDCDKLNEESISYDFIQKEEQGADSSEVYLSPNSITIDRYLVKEITSGTPEHSGIQDIAALETEKSLCIRNLENVRGGKEDAERAKLKDKQHLEDLYLSWNSSSSNENGDDEYIDRSLNDGMVLEGLLPHPNLKILTISGFRGLKLPNWMGLSNFLPHLVELYFYECNSCEQLPSLGMLPCLRILQLERMSLVQSLTEEFYYQQQESSASSNVQIREEEVDIEKKSTTSSSSLSSSGVSVFPSLVQLSLIDMSILKEWAAPHLYFISFPSLERLIVSGCLRLKSIPFTSCCSLKSLVLRNTNDEAVNLILASTGGERTSLASVSTQYSPQLEFFPVVLLPNTTRIQSLEIAHCSNFQGFRIRDNEEFQAEVFSDTGFNTSINSLCSLKLFDCPALTSLPDLREWTSLTELWIEDCDKLKDSFSYDLASLPSLRALYVDSTINLPQK